MPGQRLRNSVSCHSIARPSSNRLLIPAGSLNYCRGCGRHKPKPSIQLTGRVRIFATLMAMNRFGFGAVSALLAWCGVVLVGCHAEGQGSLARIGSAPKDEAIQLAASRAGASLDEGIRRSLEWFETEESVAHFDRSATTTHAHALESVRAFGELIASSRSPDEVSGLIQAHFEFRHFSDAVQFTAYYAPEYPASAAASDRYRYPLYAPPAELMPDNPGRRQWATRQEILAGDLLQGREIAWLDDALNAYLVQVNGSARLMLADGSTMCVGHAGTNERPYTSLGRLLIAEGMADADEMSMQTIRRLHRESPERVESLMLENDRSVFFRRLPCDQWPKSSLGITLTPEISLATDKSIFPPGGIVLVETTLPAASATRDGGAGDRRSIVRFMVDQDSGGAIKSAARADMYLGVGEAAGAIAGRQNAAGTMHYLLLRRDSPWCLCSK